VSSPISHELHPTAQKILAAATKVLTERGYAGMTLQAIAAEAQVNKSGVWYYFGGKQQLVLALLENIVIRQTGVLGSKPPSNATLAERVDLVMGSVEHLEDRARRFVAFYELLTHASRDSNLHEHLKTFYQDWYDWATEVFSPALAGSEMGGEHAATVAQFASLLLDGIFMQTIIAAPGFDFEAAWEHARVALTHLIATTVPAGEPVSPRDP